MDGLACWHWRSMKCRQGCNARADAVRGVNAESLGGQINKHGRPGLTEQCNLSEVYIRTQTSAQRR